MSSLPTIDEWIGLTDDERRQHLATWNPYAGEGAAVLEKVIERFRAEYGHLKGAEITGPGVYHGGEWVIGVSHPLVFDCRALPSFYLGLRLAISVSRPLPKEFQGQEYPKGYVWSPPHFERFVDRCAEDIRRELGNPTMSRSEMLHALVGLPFEEHVAHCREWVKRGVIPPFE